jgi:AP-3 complex subunit mu
VDVSVSQAPPLLVVEYLNRVVDTFQEYFGEVSEEIIKENFVTIYQVRSLLTRSAGLR